MNLQLKRHDQALLDLARYVRASGYRFSPITPLTHARVNARPQNAMATDLAGVFGWSRPFHRALLSQDLFDLLTTAHAVEEVEGASRSLVRISCLGDKFYIHSAYPTLSPDSVFFGPDTARFVKFIENYLAIQRPQIRRCVDIGCGGGPGAVTLAAYAPAAEVLMTDINPQALRFARINALLNGVENIRALESDILKSTDGDFDLIVANPPYLIDSSARTYRHGGGAFGEGLSIDILHESLSRLSQHGALLLYTGVAITDGRDRFLEACSHLLSRCEYAWSYVETDPDVFGEELLSEPYTVADRIAAVTLTATRKGQ